MNPVAFSIFGIEIRWYGILISLGMVIASIILIRLAKKKGIKEDTIYDLLLVVLPSAIIGARLYYVIFSLDSYNGDILAMINIREGGLAIHGGVIAGILSGYIFCRIRKLNFLELADMVAPGLILAQSIGRWGNYINGEAHGGPTDLPFGITVNGIKVHPTFLYESILNFIIFIILYRIYNKKKFNGQIIILYGILYSFIRFFIEGMRTDSLMLGNVRVAQLISIFIIAICLIFYYLQSNKNKDKY